MADITSHGNPGITPEDKSSILDDVWMKARRYYEKESQSEDSKVAEQQLLNFPDDNGR